MKRFSGLVAVLLLALCTPLFAEVDEAAAKQEWQKAYEAFETAQQAEKVQNLARALSYYRRAQTGYEAVRAKYPGWQDFLVDYRIKNCKEKTADLQRKIASIRPPPETTRPTLSPRPSEPTRPTEAPVAVPTVAGVPPALTAQLRSQSETITALRLRLDEQQEQADTRLRDLQEQLLRTRQSLTEAQGEAARGVAATEQVQNLVLQAKALREDREQLQKQVQELNDRLAVLAPQRDSALLNLQKEVERIRAAQAVAEAQAKTATNEAAELQAKIKDLAVAKANADNATQIWEAQRKELADTAAAANLRADQLQRTLGDREDALRRSEAALVEARTRTAALDARITELQQKGNADADMRKAIMEAETRYKRLEGDFKAAITRAEKAGDELALANHEAARLKAQAVAAETARDAALAQAKEAAALRDESRRQLDALNQRVNELTTTQQLALNKYQAQLALNQALTQATEGQAEKLKLAQAKAAEAQAALQALRQETADLAEMRKKAAELAEREAQVKALAAAGSDREKVALTQLREAENKLKAQQEELTAVRTDLAAARAAIVTTQEQVQQHQGRAEEIAAARKLDRDTIAKLNAELQAATLKLDQLQAENSTVAPVALNADDLEGTTLRPITADAFEAGATTTPVAEPVATPTVDTAADELAYKLQTLLHKASEAEIQGKPEAAKHLYGQALKLDEQNYTALVRLGNLLRGTGDLVEARTYLTRAWYQNPDDKDVLLPLGFILVRQEEADMAISMLSRAVALFPDNPLFHQYLGVACKSLGWLDASEVQLKRSWKLDEKNADTAFNLGLLYATMKPPKMDLARQYYRAAVALGHATDPGLDEFFGANPEK